MKALNKQDIKQVCFRYESEVKDAQDLLTGAVNALVSKGDKIVVKRGKSFWNVTFIKADAGRYSGYFKAWSSNNKAHTFHYSDIVI